MLMAKLAGSFDAVVTFAKEAQKVQSDIKAVFSTPINEIAKLIFDELNSLGYIEIVDKQWRFTKRGADYFVMLDKVSREKPDSIEATLDFVLRGYLVGLFNANNPRLSRVYDEAITIDSRYWTQVIMPTIDALLVDAKDIIKGSESILHGIDFNNAVFDIITLTPYFPNFYSYCMQQQYDESYTLLHGFESEDYDFAMSLLGLIISTAL